MLYVEIAVVIVLICVNGLLAMSELAVVSARPARLKAMIDRNVKGAGRALEPAPSGRFLFTEQNGITLVASCPRLFGATHGDRLASQLWLSACLSKPPTSSGAVSWSADHLRSLNNANSSPSKSRSAT